MFRQQNRSLKNLHFSIHKLISTIDFSEIISLKSLKIICLKIISLWIHSLVVNDTIKSLRMLFATVFAKFWTNRRRSDGWAALHYDFWFWKFFSNQIFGWREWRLINSWQVSGRLMSRFILSFYAWQTSLRWRTFLGCRANQMFTTTT